MVVCALAGAAQGQLPQGVVTGVDATQARPTIDAFVSQQVARLNGTDPAGLGSARAILIGEAGRAQASASFLDQYADSINAALKPLVNDKDARVRLNMAIVVARVAAKAGNARLAPVTQDFLHDGSDAVVLWGLQSAKYILPTLLMPPTDDIKLADTLARTVVQAVKAHPTIAVTEEAYRTLLLDPTLGGGQGTPSEVLKKTTPTLLSAYFADPMAMFDYRVKLYDDSIPPQPVAETWAVAFFIKQPVWAAQTPVQQSHALQSMLALLRGAAKQKAVDKAPETLDIIKRTGQAFEVASGVLKNPALRTAAHNVSVVTDQTGDDEIATRIGTLEQAVKSLELPAAPTAAAAPALFSPDAK